MSAKLVSCPICGQVFHIKRHLQVTCICGNTFEVIRDKGTIALRKIEEIKTRPWRARKI